LLGAPGARRADRGADHKRNEIPPSHSNTPPPLIRTPPPLTLSRCRTSAVCYHYSIGGCAKPQHRRSKGKPRHRRAESGKGALRVRQAVATTQSGWRELDCRKWVNRVFCATSQVGCSASSSRHQISRTDLLNDDSRHSIPETLAGRGGANDSAETSTLRCCIVPWRNLACQRR
jgi:hypothetical protein